MNNSIINTYLISQFLKTFLNIILIFCCLGLIMNLFEDFDTTQLSLRRPPANDSLQTFKELQELTESDKLKESKELSELREINELKELSELNELEELGGSKE